MWWRKKKEAAKPSNPDQWRHVAVPKEQRDEWLNELGLGDEMTATVLAASAGSGAAKNTTSSEPPPIPDPLEVTLGIAKTVQELQTAVSALQRELMAVQSQLQQARATSMELLRNHSLLEDYLIKIEFATRRPAPFHKRLKLKKRTYEVPGSRPKVKPPYKHVNGEDTSGPSLADRLAAHRAKKAQAEQDTPAKSVPIPMPPAANPTAEAKALLGASRE